MGGGLLDREDITPTDIQRRSRKGHNIIVTYMEDMEEYNLEEDINPLSNKTVIVFFTMISMFVFLAIVIRTMTVDGSKLTINTIWFVIWIISLIAACISVEKYSRTILHRKNHGVNKDRKTIWYYTTWVSASVSLFSLSMIIILL